MSPRRVYLVRVLVIGLWFGLWASYACAGAPKPPRRAATITLDADRYPVLLDALRAQRPHLLSSRGGPELLLIVNGGMPEPLGNLRNIPTSWVVAIERRSSDTTQPGSVSTLRVTVRTH